MLTDDASDLVAMVNGYYRLFVDANKSLVIAVPPSESNDEGMREFSILKSVSLLTYVFFQAFLRPSNMPSKFAYLLQVLSYVYSKQPIFGLTQEWLRELSFSRLECGVHDKLHISSADWWDLLLHLA